MLRVMIDGEAAGCVLTFVRERVRFAPQYAAMRVRNNMSICQRTVVVYYDEFHTPLLRLAECIPGNATVFYPLLGSQTESAKPLSKDGWSAIQVDIRPRFCSD